MSVESTITKVIYVGNGVATEWPVPFKYNKPEHLHLLVTDASGAHELVTSNFQVEVTEAGDTSILYPVSGQPLPADKRLTIFRATPQTQIVDLIYGGAFAPEVLEEDGLDREVMMIQELQEGLDRAVKVGIDADETPEELLEDIFAARDTAVDSATSAAANANAAADSAQSAAGSAAIATEQREAACICAGEAQAARDAAVLQAEAANTLMEAELAKVNAIVAANRTDQQAAVTAARQWAEKDPDTPVDYDEDGNPRYSARHWAENAQKIAIEPPTAERRGSIRVGAGLHLETGENGETDMLTADLARPDGVTTLADEEGTLSALGGNLLMNDEVLITESCTWAAPFDGWYDIRLTNGGDAAYTDGSHPGATVWPGSGKGTKRIFRYYAAGAEIPVIIGAGGIANINSSLAGIYGGATFFDGIDGGTTYILGSFFTPSTADARARGGGPGGGNEYGGPPTWYGAGGGGLNRTGSLLLPNGHQGCVQIYFHNPEKAAGPLPEPAFFMARRMAVRAMDAPATVNLYDPETGQGSVWRAEDAEAKLAEGLVTQEAWEELCAAQAAEERAAWLANPDTEAERFDMLRLARKVKLADYDAAVAELRREERSGADVSEALAAWDAYAVALCDLPSQEGAPWDGGGELTPWPEVPAVSNVQEEE